MVSCASSCTATNETETACLQPSLFDEANLAEIRSAEYPGERLVACFNPLLAEERRRKREELLAATEKELARIGREAARRKRKPLLEAAIAPPFSARTEEPSLFKSRTLSA
jgi:hypothetical protein